MEPAWRWRRAVAFSGYEQLCHERLCRAESSHTRYAVVGQEGQEPVLGLSEKFLDRPHHPFDFAIRLGVPPAAGDLSEAVVLEERMELSARKL